MGPLTASLSHRLSPWLAGAIAILALVLPAEGLGADLCPLHSTTGLPCPGCGLTRSVIAVARGDLGGALHYHPFGLLVWVWIAAVALVRWRRPLLGRIEAWEDRHPWVFRLLLAAFLAYGLGRLVRSPR